MNDIASRRYWRNSIAAASAIERYPLKISWLGFGALSLMRRVERCFDISAACRGA